MLLHNMRMELSHEKVFVLDMEKSKVSCSERTAQQPYLNSLSTREMDSLTALCDTLLPSVHTPPAAVIADKDLHAFYSTSASSFGTPQLVGGFLSERLKHPALVLIRLALWLLSTWWGTFIFCGRLSVSTRFPYFFKFSKLSEEKRTTIMIYWSSSYFYHLKMLFYSIKSIVLFHFFTQLDEKNENPSWKALGYCGPDPDFTAQIQKSISKDEQYDGPLHKGLIDPKLPKQILTDTLNKFGFSVSNKKKEKFTIHCDAVIVGSGSGGGVVAGILAKTGYKVIVLEKGDYLSRSKLSLLERQSMDKMYQNSGFFATEDLGIGILAGSTVGGGSTINWAASVQTPQHVINEWGEKYQLDLFQSQQYKEAMKVVCDKMGVQTGVGDENLNNAVVRRGCAKLGYPVTDIQRNAPPDHDCGWCCFGCKDGKKKGTAETWLVDMVESGNGVIFCGCEVTKILRKGTGGKTATGVAFEFDNGNEKNVYVVQSKVTIVAGGAFGTPILLKKSGFKNANIGKHLHLHPVAMSWGYFPNEPISSYEGGRGIITAMSTVVGEFDESGYGAVIQTPSLHPGLFSAAMPWVSGMDMKERMSRFSKTVHAFGLARDKGSGTVKSFSTVSYHMDQSDEDNLKRGLEKALRILAAAGAEEIGTHHFNGKKLNVKRASSYEFEQFVKEESSRGLKGLSMPIYSAHQMGSCRMGVDPKTSVVNKSGETWEVEGVFLADSSVFPTALGVNPMVTIQSIAYCTAQAVVGFLQTKS